MDELTSYQRAQAAYQRSSKEKMVRQYRIGKNPQFVPCLIF
jgi:t-SNARE complex subunit (syntaxin)